MQIDKISFCGAKLSGSKTLKSSQIKSEKLSDERKKIADGIIGLSLLGETVASGLKIQRKIDKLVPLEEVDCSDFSKLDAEQISDMIKIVKNSKCQPARMFYSQDGKSVSKVWDYDFNTGNLKREVVFNSDGSGILSISEFNLQSGNFLKRVWYDASTKNVSKSIDYDCESGNPIKYCFYNEVDGNPEMVKEFGQAGGPKRVTWYRKDGNTPNQQIYYNENGNVNGYKLFSADGKVESEIICDTSSGAPIKKLIYGKDGKSVIKTIEYNK